MNPQGLSSKPALFQTGKIYACRSIADQDCVFRFKVVRRTDKTLWLDYMGETLQVRARFHGMRGEACSPLGRYSMAPTLWAYCDEVDNAG